MLFGWLFKMSANYPTYLHGLFDAVSSVFAISGPANHNLSPNFSVMSFYALVVCGGIIVGVTHLGVFVSHLYTMVSRR
jgi:hypothetical protein